MEIKRIDGRRFDNIRNIRITKEYLMHPSGSVLIEMGNTKVICTATVEDKTAQHLKGTGQGWITAEYGMLPGSTGSRKVRDATRGKIDGRSQEIQRLIGRSLRSVIDMNVLGERTIWIDCDVIQADGGTRTAAITGSFVALYEALKKMKASKMIKEIPVHSFISAISVGIVDDSILLDLCYAEDANAQVDMNVVMNDKGQYIELQGTGEENPFKKEELRDMLFLAEKGCMELIKAQKEAIGELE